MDESTFKKFRRQTKKIVKKSLQIMLWFIAGYLIYGELAVFFVLGFLFGEGLAILRKHKLNNEIMAYHIILLSGMVGICSSFFGNPEFTAEAVFFAFGAIFGYPYYCKPKWINGLKQY